MKTESALLRAGGLKTTKVFQIRNQRDVPFYCNPLHLFFAIWLLMLSVLQLHISYTTYPDISLALILFGASAISFVAGFATLRWAYAAISFWPKGDSRYRINLTLLRKFNFWAIVVSLAIMTMNLVRFGLPPIFGVFGVDTLDYQEYGSLRQVLFAALLTIFVSAPLEVSTWRRWSLYIFSPLGLLVYGSRGYLLIMLFQALAVFSLRTRLSKAKIYTVAAITMAAAVLLSNLIGNSRNSLGVAALLATLQIRHAYYDWPSAYLWAIAYVSAPFSNMCWIVRTYPYNHPSLSFIYSALPQFWSPKPLEIGDLGSEYIIDGVHTYLAKYYLDFWFFGIFGINYLWGLIASFMTAGDRLTRNYLVSSVLLGCIAFMFFSDFLTILIILMELAVLAILQRFVFIPETVRASSKPLITVGTVQS